MQALRSIFNYIVRDIKVGLALLCTELNDFIIQLDEEVEGMQSTILVLQQQLKETRQQLAQYQQQQSQAAGPSTSRTTSSEPVGQAEATGKDCIVWPTDQVMAVPPGRGRLGLDFTGTQP